MIHYIIFVNSVWENYKSGVDFTPIIRELDDEIFQSCSSKAYKAGLSIKKKAVHDLTAEESVSPEQRILLEE